MMASLDVVESCTDCFDRRKHTEADWQKNSSHYSVSFNCQQQYTAGNDKTAKVGVSLKNVISFCWYDGLMFVNSCAAT